MAAPTTTAPAKTKSVTPTVTKDQAARQPAAESADGKRMFKRQNGEMIELPPDMSIFEAIKIEMEALAAEKKLGKGPPPKPVPVIKKDKKEPEKKKPKGDSKKKGLGEKGKGKGGAAGKAAMLAMGKSLVSKYLVGKASPVLMAGIAKLAKLKMNEQTHEDAAQKLGNTTKAVVHPPAEGQAKSNTGQVGDVDAKPAPKPDPQKAKDKLKQSLEENIPSSIEDVDNFKKNKKGQHISADVMGVVNTDKNAVTGTFNEVTATPAPAPPEQIPEALPPEEIQPATPGMNLGAGAIAPLQKEHTDVNNFNKEADAKLQEEGVSQEQLDMVDSGDLAEANKEKKNMKKKSVTEPAQINQFAKTETTKIDTDLKKEETKEKDNLKKQRKGALGATAGKQKATKTALEKKREEVAAKINLIYTTAQTSVKKKLDNLETAAMKKFDDGNAAASKEFEDNVKREIDAFKDRRYSGFWGWAKKAKDWLLGMDDLPEVKAIFDNNRAAFVSKIDKLVADIGEENKRVVQECKDELANAKKQIKEYVDKLGPDLKDAGKKAQEEMNEKLDELDKFVAKKEEELKNKLKDKQQAAIKAIDEKIEKMKEAMSGALSKLGKLLLLAAKKFFTWALEKFGFSLADIEGIINKGAAVLKAIFTQPIKFVKNLMNAALTGFKNFGKNFLKHLQDALFEWLTGSLEGLVLPKTWNVQGILGLLLQMIGISYQNIRKHMVTVMGEPVVAGLEKSFTLVKTLITEGPMAAWEQLKEMAGEMKEAFIEAVKDFIKMKIVEQAIQWLVSLFVPGAGIIKAIVGIYDTVMFFIQKAKTIMQMVGNFLSSISDIAAGNIGAAADAMENGLARGLSLVINFLAALLRLNGITAKIKAALEKIRAKVDGVMHKVAVWIKDKAKKLWGGVKKTAGDIKNKLFSWVFAKKSFTASDGKSHSLNVEEVGGKPKLIMRSTPHPVIDFLDAYANTHGGRSKIPQNKQADFNTAYSMVDANGSITKKIAEVDKAEQPTSTFTDAQKTALRNELLVLNTVLSEKLKNVVGETSSLATTKDKYKLEGTTGRYSKMITKLKGDELTPDHQPQGSILKLIKRAPYSSVFTHLSGSQDDFYQNGYAIMIHFKRHTKGRTYGRSVSVFEAAYESGFMAKPTPKEKRAYFINALESERDADANAMNAAVNTPESDSRWDDLNNFNLTAPEKTLLYSEIKKNIIDGQRTIKSQSFLHLKAATD